MSKYTIEDLMDRSAEIEKVCAIVGDLPNNEHTCIAIEGNWGSGKTHVMNILQGEFGKDNSNIVIKYDAWENSYYDDPLITILYCILDKLKYEATDDKALKKIVKATLKAAKKDWDSAKDNILKKIAEGGKASANFKIALACCLIEKIVSIGKTATTSLLDNAKFSDFRSYQSLLNDSKDFLNKLTEGGKKIVLLVDEVDRCLPYQQFIVLERLHHLFQIKNSAVIVALNKRVVKEAYEKRYCGDKSSLGDDYLKKFFEYEIELSDKEYTLFNNFMLKYLRSNMKQNPVKAQELVSDIYFVISQLLKNSKRVVKLDARNIQTYRRTLEKILGEKGKGENIGRLEFWFTAIMLYIKMFDPGIMHYDEFKSGKRETAQDFFDLNYILHANLLTNFDFNSPRMHYNEYADPKYNRYQYLLNYCLYRHTDGNGVEYIKGISDYRENYFWIDKVFETIDKYCKR